MGEALTGISSMATRLLLADLAAAWRAQGGDELRIESVGGLDAARRVKDGERFDLVFLAMDALWPLEAAGHVVAGSVTALMRSPVAAAVRGGDPPPMISTEHALRDAVLAAPRIGYSTGPSGVTLLKLFERWGVLDALRARLVQAPPGVSVGSLLARGEVDLGFQQWSELMHVGGITVIGTLPPGTEIITAFGGGVCAEATQPEQAVAVLDFIRSSDADATKRRHGMWPA